MGPERLPKVVMDSEVDGRRKRGRPKSGWRHQVKDMMAGYCLTEEQAEDRVAWKKNLKKKIVDLNFKVHNTYTLAVIMDVVINIYADMLVSKG
uniref:Uncharacterized protein n=1 Tax=Rhodnius prolixus TaxID=13249 RepID=T1HYG0_RHOPR